MFFFPLVPWEMQLEPTTRPPRRLAAIAFADVVGWSQLIERDDAGTALAWQRLRIDHIEPALSEHGGRVLKLLGDAVVVEFASTVESVKWAIGLQQRLGELRSRGETALRMRIGVGFEDVIVDDSGDLLGDGVNVAARIQHLAARRCQNQAIARQCVVRGAARGST